MVYIITQYCISRKNKFYKLFLTVYIIAQSCISRKKTVLETVFNGVYSNEMMSATKPAPEEVIQLKKECN